MAAFIADLTWSGKKQTRPMAIAWGYGGLTHFPAVCVTNADGRHVAKKAQGGFALRR
jgi:hypothetical protein